MAKKVKLYVFIIGMVLFISALSSCSPEPKESYSADEIRAFVATKKAVVKDSLILNTMSGKFKYPIVMKKRHGYLDIYYPAVANNGAVKYYYLPE